MLTRTRVGALWLGLTAAYLFGASATASACPMRPCTHSVDAALERILAGKPRPAEGPVVATIALHEEETSAEDAREDVVSAEIENPAAPSFDAPLGEVERRRIRRTSSIFALVVGMVIAPLGLVPMVNSILGSEAKFAGGVAMVLGGVASHISGLLGVLRYGRWRRRRSEWLVLRDRTVDASSSLLEAGRY